jgi:hypothetical protein
VKLADLILNSGVDDPRRWVTGDSPRVTTTHDVQASIQAATRQATIVEATNVYWYCREMPATTLYDLPCAAPPHDAMLVEWKQENGKRCGTLGQIRNPPFRIGAHTPGPVVGENGLRHLLPPKVNLSGRVDIVPMWLSNNMPDQAAWDRVRWVWGVGVFQEDFGRAFGPLATVSAALDEWGRLMDTKWDVHFPLKKDAEAKDVNPLTLHPFMVFLMTMNFMQCANIELTYVDPPAALSRKHRKKGKLQPGQDLVRYHTLGIRPAGAGTRTRGRSSSSSGDLVAFHPVRGEFHHYGDCCPGLHGPKGLLFGKLTGRFWVPAHVRGNPQRGTIKQEFVVEP